MDKPGYAEFWDAMYHRSEHLEYWEESAVSPEFMEAVAGMQLPAGARVLDIGCGTGLEACRLSQQGYLASGIDISPEAIRLAKERASSEGASVEFSVGSALQLPYPDRSFELLTDRGCLHLIPHSKWGRYAAEASRVLVDGGCLLLRACSDPSNPDFSHFDEVGLQEHFTSHGFSAVSRREVRLLNRRGGLPAIQALLRRKGDG